MDVPLPGESKEEAVGTPHIRTASGSERGVDQVKVENIGAGAGRQAGGPPGQGYSKYQKSLPPRFQRQQQVCLFVLVPSKKRNAILNDCCILNELGHCFS